MRSLLKAGGSADALSNKTHRFLETQTNSDTQPSGEGKTFRQMLYSPEYHFHIPLFFLLQTTKKQIQAENKKVPF